MDNDFTPTPENTKPKKHIVRWMLWLILIVIIVGAGRFGYEWWKQQIQTHATQWEQAQQTASQNNQTITAVQQQVTSLQQQNTGLTQAFSQLQHQVQQLQQTSRPATMVLLDVQQLVELAQLSLASNNASGALSGLQAAQTELSVLPASGNVDLFASIQQDIQHVQAVSTADHSKKIISTVDKLAENFSDFTVEMMINTDSASDHAAAAPTHTLWQKWSKYWSPYIHVQRQGDHSIHDIAFFTNIQETVSLKLLQAENALLQHRLDLYQADLAFVHNLVNTSSFSSSSLVQAWLNQLTAVMSQNPTSAMPTFAQTQQLLKSHLQALQTASMMMPGPMMPAVPAAQTNPISPAPTPNAPASAPQKPVQPLQPVEA